MIFLLENGKTWWYTPVDKDFIREVNIKNPGGSISYYRMSEFALHESNGFQWYCYKPFLVGVRI